MALFSKFRDSINYENLDVDKLTEEEKYAYLTKFLDSNVNNPIIFDIIDSLPKETQSMVADSIIIQYCDNKNNDFAHKLIDKYFNDYYLKEYVFKYNVYPYIYYATIAFEKIYNKLSQEEIEYVLRAYYNKNSKSELEILVKNNYDISFLFDCDYLFSSGFNIISPEQRFQLLLKSDKNITSSYLYGLNKEDQIYIRVFKDGYFGFDENDIEDIKKFFLKYYKEIINNKDKINNYLIDSFNRNDINTIIDELDLDDNIKNELKSIFAIEVDEYEDLYKMSLEESAEYIMSISHDELIKIIRNSKLYFRMGSLPKEKQIEIIKISNDYLNRASEELIDEILKNKIIEVSNEMLLSLVRYDNYVNILTDDEPKEYKSNISEIYNYYAFDTEKDCIDFIERAKLVDEDANYLEVINKVAEKLIKFNSKHKFRFNNINTKELLEKYPNIIKILDITSLSEENLLYLYDSLKNDLDYLAIKLKICNKDANYNDDIIRFLTLADVNEYDKLEGYGVNNLYADICELMFYGKLPKELVKKVYSYDKIINYLSYPKKEDLMQVSRLLDILDPTGKLTIMFNKINERELRTKINKNKDTPNVSTAQFRFLQNALVILKNIRKIEELYKTNPNLLFTFNYELLNILDWDDITFYSKYASINDLHLEKLLNNKEAVRKQIDYVKEHLPNYREEVYLMLLFFSKMNDTDQKEYFEKFNVNDTIYFIHEKPLFVSDIVFVDLLEKIKNNESNKTKNIIQNENITKEELLNVICLKVLGISYEMVNKIYYEFFSDLDILLKDKSILNEEEIDYIDKLYKVKELINIDNVEQLKDEYLKKYQNVKTPDYVISLKIQKDLRILYNKEKIDKLYSPKEKDFQRNIFGVKVYELSSEFNMLLTVVGAYVKSSKLKFNPYKDWNNPSKNTNQNICTSLINESNLSFARQPDSIIFGFYNLNENDIVKEAPYDLGSNSSSIVVKTHVEGQCRTTKNEIDNTRHGHNELLVSRINGTKKRQPDYIIAVDTVTPQDINAARAFGIPIVCINTVRIAKYNVNKINNAMNYLNNNIDISKLKELIILYNNNYTGLITLSTSLLKKYYAPLKFENHLLDYIKMIIETRNKSLIYECLEVVKEEYSKYEDIPREYWPYDFRIFTKFLENILNIRTIESNNLTQIMK